MEKRIIVILLVLVLTLNLVVVVGEAVPTKTPVLYDELSIGSKGENVLKLKQRFFELEYFRTEKFNDKFTDNTAKTVRQFEKDHGLPVDGIADNEMLNLLYAEPSTSAYVYDFGTGLMVTSAGAFYTLSFTIGADGGEEPYQFNVKVLRNGSSIYSDTASAGEVQLTTKSLSSGTYVVNLTVKDKNGETSKAKAEVKITKSGMSSAMNILSEMRPPLIPTEAPTEVPTVK